MSFQSPTVQGFFDPDTHTVSYIVSDPVTKAAAIIDPVLGYLPRIARTSTTAADALLTVIQTQQLDLLYLLETHAHADHLSAADYLREKTGTPIMIGAGIRAVRDNFAVLFEIEDRDSNRPAFDGLLDDGDTLPLGSLHITILHTPGHTPACLTYVVGDAAFVGDTLFMPDYGTARADFPGGDARTLYRSIRKILALPPETRLFSGHDYLPATRKTPAWEATVGSHRANNVHVHDGVAEAKFVVMRKARDKTLEAPALILPAIQVNIQAGRMPPASKHGHVFLRLPVNAI